MKPYRRKLRKNMTLAETALWQLIKNRQLKGVRFLRQYSVNNFIVDFYCPIYKLAIELDGEGHQLEDQVAKDQQRTEILNVLGITVIRFENFEVLDYPEMTLAVIAQYLH
jgi:Uncharacterized protein conserved in bacteria